MGHIKHHAIIVTDAERSNLVIIRDAAIQIFSKRFGEDLGDKLISPIISGVINAQHSFFIAPDGSKEGWDGSNAGDSARKEFLDWLHASKFYADYAEIMFGGDDERDIFLRSKDKDLYETDSNNNR